MAPPVFTVASEESIEKKAQVHLLPCRIDHDGNVSPIDTYWSPSDGNQDQIKTAYLRGRKLYGKAVKLPDGYYGAVVEKSEPKSKTPRHEDDAELQEESDDQQLEAGAMQGKTSFEEVIVWGHESTADSSSDPYVRSMEEWIAFAEQIHSYPSEAEPSGKQGQVV
ncbi:ribonuclease H2, subunit C [Xylariaceae sp. FL0662B]|nr:ribonuclease H2, subunit C [Xylariaceae sp. FL0662B]